MAAKKAKAEGPGKSPGPVLTRRKVRDGVIESEILSIDLTTGDHEAEWAAMRELFKTVPEQVQAYADRAQHVIDSGATGSRLQYAQDALWQAKELLHYLDKGDAASAVQHTLWMMSAFWRLDVKGVEPTIVTGARATRQRSKAGFSSGEQRAEARRPEWEQWQRYANRVCKENPALKKTRILEIVAAKFGRTRQAIAKRVIIE